MPWVELFADFIVFANKRRFYPFSYKSVRKLGMKIDVDIRFDRMLVARED